MAIWDAQRSDRALLARQGRWRTLTPKSGYDFSSNDYLGLAGGPRLRAAVIGAAERGVQVGSGGSRLLRGNACEHEALEAQAAVFFGSEAALFFGSGFSANTALLATLPQREDLVVYDDLVHASAHEGARLSRAPAVQAGHNDPERVEQAIARWRREGGLGTPWIVVESLYSMDGDMAPLALLLDVANRCDAVLLIDEAHATGVFGPEGRGLAADLEGCSNVITLRTCGKALGCEGALVCGPTAMRDALVNRARAFIFSTAPSPLMAEAVREALRILADEPQRRARLAALCEVAGRALGPVGATCAGSQIFPVVIGDEGATMEVAARLQAAGFDVRGIRPPTVPPGTARLRISITLNVDEPAIWGLADALREVQA